MCSADGALLYKVTKQDSAARKVVITKTSTRPENDPLGTIEMRYPDDNICECLGSDMNISRDGLGAPFIFKASDGKTYRWEDCFGDDGIFTSANGSQLGSFHKKSVFTLLSGSTPKAILSISDEAVAIMDEILVSLIYAKRYLRPKGLPIVSGAGLSRPLVVHPLQ